VFVLVFSPYYLSGVSWKLFECGVYRQLAGSFGHMLVQRHIFGVCHGIMSVHFWFTKSMYPAHCIWHSNLALLVLSNCCFLPYSPVLGSTGQLHYFIFSFLNQNPHLGSGCGKTATLDHRKLIIKTSSHL